MLGVLIVLSAACKTQADDFAQRQLDNWHQWRGPLASGVAPQADPPIEWGDGKNMKWKVDIPGRGSASPVVWENYIFILTAIETDRTGGTEQAHNNTAGPVFSPRSYTGDSGYKLSRRHDRCHAGTGRPRDHHSR